MTEEIPMTEEKEWYTSQEAAAYLGIPMHRLSRLRRTGRINGVTGGGEHTRYAMYHIDELRKTDTTDLRTRKPKQSQEQSEKAA